MIDKKLSTYLNMIIDVIKIIDSKTLKVIDVTKGDLINLTKIADYSEGVTFIGL